MVAAAVAVTNAQKIVLLFIPLYLTGTAKEVREQGTPAPLKLSITPHRLHRHHRIGDARLHIHGHLLRITETPQQAFSQHSIRTDHPHGRHGGYLLLQSAGYSIKHEAKGFKTICLSVAVCAINGADEGVEREKLPR
jgi:hypothetical protein